VAGELLRSSFGSAREKSFYRVPAMPLSPTGAELLFEVFSQGYERGSTIVTSNLPFDEWTSVFGSERLTGALLDRLTHHVHILEMNGDSFRLAHSKRRSRKARPEPSSGGRGPEESSKQSLPADAGRTLCGAPTACGGNLGRQIFWVRIGRGR
jgi:IstB-like ATP binding protein